MKNPKFSLQIFAVIFLGIASSVAFAEKPSRKHFGKGHSFAVEELPNGKLKSELKKLDPKAKKKAMDWLHELSFHEFDAADHLRVDRKGGVFIVCPDGHGNCDGKHHKHHEDETSAETSQAPESTDEPTIENPPPPTVQEAAVPVSSPPVYNSKPGATRHIYLDFNGAMVADKNWTETDNKGTPDDFTDDITWDSWDCYAWSIDADKTTFSDTEQAKIRQIWERIAEDFAPFDVNVTTDVTYDPDTYTGDKNKVGWLLFTPRTDKLGARCPHYGSGGVAYVGVYGDSDFFSNYQPAWVKAETTTSAPDMAEAASHEMGHNMGLSHDGRSSPAQEYYGGHAGSPPSWGPMMGTGYGRNVTQWSKGEYYNANQTQDDLLIISGRVPYRSDDHGNSPGAATAWLDSNVNQKGIIERTNDLDYFAFSTGAGTLTFNANTYRCEAETWGGNLDILLELYNQSNVLVASNNPASEVHASISYEAVAGTYYLLVKPVGVGSPANSTPSGYTVYGSLGQYTVTGSFVPTDSLFMTSPIGGENWVKSTSRNITWLSGMGGNVKIELFKGGVLNSTIAASTPNDGSFSWNVSKDQLAGSDYKIKITSIETPAISDESESNFTISAPSNNLLIANMDTNPGFTTTGEFEFGVPSGVNKPASAKTGTNIYDTNLDATSYTASTLTTYAIDCSNHKNVNLEFWANAYVFTDFTIKFEVSNDNSTWTELFSQVGLNSNTWIKYSYDISAVADGESTVYVRWSMLGSGSQYTGSGLAIDDVQITGDFIPVDDIYLVTPDGGETLTRQIANEVKWTSGMGGNVKIELFKADVLYTTIISTTPNDGLYEFVLPSGVAAANDYKIKITSIEQSSTSDMSTANFAIVAPSNNLLVTNLDTDPGFTTTGLFEYGTPVSPNIVLNAKTGTNIYDTDLNATCFGNNTLTTMAIDCSNHTAVNLEFWAYAYIYAGYAFNVEVSNNNSTWTQLFSQAGVTNNSWVKHTYNISAVADGMSTVYVRWSMIGTGTQWTGGGISIDDISITGTFSPPALSYTVSYEGNGSTGGSVPVNQIKEHGVNLALAGNSGNLTKTGFTFGGWNTQADGLGTNFSAGAAYSGNSSITLYAKWNDEYDAWAETEFENDFVDTTLTSNPDGDGLTNLQEFAFGTDPTSSTMRQMQFEVGAEVTQGGVPVLRLDAQEYHAVFVRRKDHVAAGLTYTVEFSADLKAWESINASTGDVLTGAGSSEHEAVSVTFPDTVPVHGGGAEQPPKFFRVGVQQN